METSPGLLIKKKRPLWSAFHEIPLANDLYVYRTHLAAVLRVSFYVEGNLLALIQGLEAIHHDRREMNEYIVTAFII